MRVTNWYQEQTLSQLLQVESAYPTVVIVTNDHQNPSSDPAKKDLGKSTWFQFMSCTKTRAPWEDNLTSLYCVPFYAPPTRKVCVYGRRSLKLTYLYLFFLVSFAKFCCLYSFWWNLLHLSIWNVICLEVSFLEEPLTVDYCLLAQSPMPGILLGTKLAPLSPDDLLFIWFIWVTYQSPHHDSSEVCHKTGDNYSRPAAEDRE